MNTLKQVQAALTLSGYGHDDIFHAEFIGQSRSGNEMHRIHYRDPDAPGGIDTGTVYIDRYGRGEF